MEAAILPLPSSLEIEQLAKDARALARARESAAPRLWSGLGRSPGALWGACRGSSTYTVAVTLEDRVGHCTCPSRQRPCRHVVALLLLAAAEPTALPEAPPPEDVAAWLARRDAKRKPAAPAKPPDPEARRRRSEQRLARIVAGAEALDRWLADLARGGLAALAEHGDESCAREAARLVDAQAPGLAARVAALPALVGAGLDWPERVLAALGRVALLTRAVRRLDALPAAVADDVRDAIGWATRKDEVLARGERVVDVWQVVAQVEEIDDDDLRQQRTWLTGAGTGRRALVLQFAYAGRPYPEPLAPGMAVPAQLAFWPGAHPRRALFAERADPLALPLPLADRRSIRAALGEVADTLAACPWRERFGLTLGDVVPVAPRATDAPGDGGGWLVDADGDALPLADPTPWPLIALSGGHPLDVVGEWLDGRFTALAAVADGRYHRLDGRRPA